MAPVLVDSQKVLTFLPLSVFYNLSPYSLPQGRDNTTKLRMNYITDIDSVLEQ